jgi:hypothetical protein
VLNWSTVALSHTTIDRDKSPLPDVAVDAEGALDGTGRLSS